MKAIVASLFATLFAVSMPVQAEWETDTHPVEYVDWSIKTIRTYYQHESGETIFLVFTCPIQDVINRYAVHKKYYEGFFKRLFPFGEKGESISIEIRGSIFIEYWRFSDFETTPFLVRFDDEPASIVHIVMGGFTVLNIAPDEFRHQFRLDLENHEMLRMNINMPDDYINVRFNITGFKETYDSHCD